jgi:uncharacterized Zn-finger protein
MSESDAMAPVVVQPSDLPAFCPNPKMPLWSSHPRVFLDIADEGEAMCPTAEHVMCSPAARGPGSH